MGADGQLRFVAAAVLGTAFAFSSAHAAVTEANVVVVKGSVTATAEAAPDGAPVEKGDAISVGSTIATGNASEVLMSPFPAAAVRILENNRVVLRETDLEKSGETILGRKAKLQLTRGSVQAGFDKIAGSDLQFQVVTPQCVAAARGTIFCTKVTDVPRDEKVKQDQALTATTTIVLEGAVEMPWTDANGVTHNVTVGPGMKASIRQTTAGLVQDGPSPATGAELDALLSFTRDSVDSGLLGTTSTGGATAIVPKTQAAPLNAKAAPAAAQSVLPPSAPLVLAPNVAPTTP